MRGSYTPPQTPSSLPHSKIGCFGPDANAHPKQPIFPFGVISKR